MLIHSLICVLFLVYAGCCRRPGRGINTGLPRLFCRAMVGCCRRPGRGINTGLTSWVCKAAAAFVRKRLGLLKSAFFLPAFPMGVTGWLAFEHGHTVRFLDGPFGTVRVCVAGGMNANVFTCFSVGGTGLNDVTVRLFFTAGGIGDPRVVLIFRFSLSGSGMSFFSAALSLLRGFGAAWSFVLEGPGVWWLLSVSLRLFARCPRPRLFDCFSVLVLGSAAVLDVVSIRGLHSWQLMKTCRV